MDVTPRLHSPSTGVVITGGASGLGRATAEALAAVGRPVSLWDLDAEKTARVADEIARRYEVPTQGLAVDVRDPKALERGVASARQAMPNIGGLVHAAGVVDTDSLDGLTAEGWDDGIRVHLRPVALLAKALLPDLAAQPGSAIVAFASINATLGNAANPIYSAAKGGALSLVRSLADRLARDGIRINAISPGQIRTPMLAPSVEHLGEAAYTRRILLERLGEPEEIGRVVRFLLSDEASYITAAEIVVDGGNISSQRM
ncbi:MAG: SDR family oxidoreductase [Spirochaetaceae bacterium]|nr:SDR family oxidoreductase [Myxococcales bacterium]MCB9723273.1 SDR family oxidoreductase [Spirochaetaceae bacterium]HPG24406.1 SDR family oxidoreductase [Myxococcota bacterium]